MLKQWEKRRRRKSMETFLTFLPFIPYIWSVSKSWGPFLTIWSLSTTFTASPYSKSPLPLTWISSRTIYQVSSSVFVLIIQTAEVILLKCKSNHVALLLNRFLASHLTHNKSQSPYNNPQDPTRLSLGPHLLILPPWPLFIFSPWTPPGRPPAGQAYFCLGRGLFSC